MNLQAIDWAGMAQLAIGITAAVAATAGVSVALWKAGWLRRYVLALPGQRKAALVIAVITALAEIVIVYDLYASGVWLAPGPLAAAKTAAFVILFIGSLIAEMQPLRRPVRGLLFGAVVILGLYQAQVNVLVNYHHAELPATVPQFFIYILPAATPADTRFWAAVADGTVRTVVVVIMWLTTGLVWRGEALEVGEAAAQTRRRSRGKPGHSPAPAATSGGGQQVTEHQLRQIGELVAIYRAQPEATLGEVVAQADSIGSETVAGKVRRLALAHGYLSQGEGRSFQPNGRALAVEE